MLPAIKRQTLAAAVIAPVSAFVLARVVLTAAALSVHADPFAGATWIKWDAGIYLDIARNGYTLFPCGPGTGTWCGNAGWLPAFPAFVRLLGQFRLPWDAAVLVTSGFFALLTLIVLWNGLLRRGDAPSAIACLLLAAFFPGAIYQHAGFPISMVLFFVVLSLWLVTTGRWLAAACLGACAAATYPIGLAIAPALAFGTWWLSGGERVSRVLKAMTAAVVTAAGFGVVLLIHWITVGAWDAFFRVQSRYGHGLFDPAVTFWHVVRPLFLGQLDLPVDTPAIQTLVVAVFALTAAFLWLRAQERATIDALVLIAGLALWLAPLTFSTGGEGWRAPALSLYRSEALVLPLVVLMRRLRLPMLAPVVVVFIVLAFFMARLFFQRILV